MKKKIDEIAQFLNSEVIVDVGLLTGIGGQILTCSNLFLLKKTSHEWLFQLLNFLEEKLIKEPFLATHCSGLSGVGWLYEYLSEMKVIDYDTNVLLEDFDIYLEQVIKNFIKESNYDFLHGGAGVALYFIKRMSKKKKLVSVLNRFLEDLENLCIPHENKTVKWKSLLGNHIPKYGYNISLSHGMSSIISILSKLYEIEEIDKEKTEILLRGTVKYILAQEIDKEKYGSYFPNFALESSPTISKSRLAWCYGDLGIASAFYQAGKVLDEKEWINKALEVFLFAATKRRNLEDNFVKDAGLCHGTSSIGHIFYRMWWNTKLLEFKRAADYWFSQTLEMAKFEDGIVGFKAFEMSDKGDPMWVNKYGLLDGISGIGLAMLTYYYESEPAWDECLLLS